MKILHVINSIDEKVGGQFFALKSILLMEKNIGFKSEILTSFNNNISSDFIEKNKVHLFPFSFPKRFYNSKKAIQFLIENIKSFDLVILHGVWSMLLYRASFHAANANIHIMMWPHGSLDPTDLKKKFLIKKIVGNIFIKKMIDRQSLIICTTLMEKKLLVTYGIKKKISVCPLPVINDSLIGRRSHFRKKYNLGSEDFTFLFLSRIVPDKGLEMLIECLGNISEKFNIKLIVAGTGNKNYLNKIKKIILRKNLKGCVKFIGHISDQKKADAFKGCDCYALPSRKENFGIAVVESLQHGTPVLISNRVYIKDEIINGDSGWVCEYSKQSLQDTLLYILFNKTDYLQKQRNAKRVGSIFLLKNLTHSYKKLYHSI